MQRAAATDVQRMVAYAEGRILVSIAHNAATPVFATDVARHAGTRVDIAATPTQICFVIKALQCPVLGAEKRAAARLTAGVTVAAALLGTFGAKEDRLRATKGGSILLACVCNTSVSPGTCLRPTGIDCTDAPRILIGRWWWGRQAGDVQQGQKPSVTQRDSPVAREQYTQIRPRAS